jgi:hypothetical protein
MWWWGDFEPALSLSANSQVGKMALWLIDDSEVLRRGMVARYSHEKHVAH